MYLFSGKIKCMDCKKNFRGKKQRGKSVYICNGYHNKQTNCKRFVLKEEDLLETIHKHFVIKNRWGDLKIDNEMERVEYIEAYSEDEKYIIKYEDEKEKSIISKNHVKF